jgi:Zinc carboxypeptidase
MPTRHLLVFIALFLASNQAIAQQSIRSPQEFFPHDMGGQFSRHDQINDYMDYLAAVSANTMRIEKYGDTYEQRPLKIAIFSSPENIAQIESVRTNHLRQSGLLSGEPTSMQKIAVVWLSMSVHGNEPSGAECSPQLAYQLATQTDPQIKAWLRNTVVIVDPALNPDGYSRYTNWYRSVSSKHRNQNKLSREHNEPWPGGRSNHYQFDLNRDWAWATQTESAARLEVYHKWYPHLHADLHEQYVDNPYYFPPAAEPMHSLITPFQRQFQEVVGKNHAGYFDKNNWLYFTREWFDLFYPSYGDTYPMFNGSIGMTYEQAGHSTAGRLITMSNGDTLSLYDRILHHRTTSLSTIEVASQNADRLCDEMASYFQKAKTEGSGSVKTYVIPMSQQPERVRALLRLLDRHRIKYGQAGAAISGSGWSYQTGKETNIKIQPDDVVIPVQQAQANLLTVLFQAQSDLADSVTYDITAWSLPYAYGVEVFSLRQILLPKGRPGFTAFTPTPMVAHPYAWAINRGSTAQLRMIGQLIQKGIKVRYANKAFTMGDKTYDSGTFIINHADNRNLIEELDSLVQAQAALAGQIECRPIFNSWANSGPNFGSENMILMEAPSIAVVYGDQADANSYGHVWYYFEQVLDYPFTDIKPDQITGLNLDGFNTLIFADGNYTIDEEKLKTIQSWVKAGGRLITMDGATKTFAGLEGFKWESVSLQDAEKNGSTQGHYHATERSGISNSLSGAIIETHLDPTHPISAGIGGTYFTLKTNAHLYASDSTGNNTPIWIPAKPASYGFIGANVRPKMPNSASVSVQKVGQGKAILFADNPLFRSFWYMGGVLFGNALFF